MLTPQLTEAEQKARALGWSYQWEPDTAIGTHRCSLMDGGEILASVGEIQEEQPRREVEAELASVVLGLSVQAR